MRELDDLELDQVVGGVGVPLTTASSLTVLSGVHIPVETTLAGFIRAFADATWEDARYVMSR